MAAKAARTYMLVWAACALTLLQVKRKANAFAVVGDGMAFEIEQLLRKRRRALAALSIALVALGDFGRCFPAPSSW